MSDKRSCYSEETLEEAVKLVNEDGFSYGDAQLATGIPKSTIFKYSKASVVKKQKPGRISVLTQEEELCLVQWTMDLVKVGFPGTDSDLLDQVQGGQEKSKSKKIK